MLAYSGKGKFIISSICLNDFVKEISQLIESSISKKASLTFRFAEDLPLFEGDATQIRQIVMNLIINASEALGEEGGRITISTGCQFCDRAYLDTSNAAFQAGLSEPLSEGEYVFLEISDTGCGMDAETQEKIFDPFFTTKFTGRGLGMAAVLGIVRGHKGVIKLYSELGKGTTFKVLFSARQEIASPNNVETEPATKTTWRGKGTILVADDEDSVCFVCQEMLEQCGFKTLTAADGKIALDLFDRHRDEIVCVILDLTMPNMDGEQAFHEIKRLNSGVKVLLSSGFDEQEIAQRFAGRGLAGFIQKPYNLHSLQKTLQSILDA